MADQRLERCAGLVFGFLFHGTRSVPINEETLAGHLNHPHDWIWLNLALADHRAHRFLEGFGEIPQAARELMLTPQERIQIHLTARGGFGLLPDIKRDFADDIVGAGRLAFWCDDRHLITARRHPLRAIEQLRGAVEQGDTLASPAEAVARLQESFSLSAEQRLAVLGGELGHIEDEVLADRDHIGRGALGPLRREVSRYAREFSALRGAIHRAMAPRNVVENSPLMTHLPHLQQHAEDLERHAAAVSERARLLYEEIGGRVAERTNRALSALTVISTLLLPPTFVVGAFGMNVGGVPWTQNAGGFWTAIVLCAVLVAAGWLVLKRFRIVP